jgi:nucleotide-binding universal stress UspA family protein
MMIQIRNIVVPVDFSEEARAAVARAIMLARLEGASVHLVHAMQIPLVATPYEISLPTDLWEGVQMAVERRLEAARRAIEAEGVATVTAQVTKSDNPFRTIDAVVREYAADLIVMGTHGYSGLRHAFHRSVAERTVRDLDCPVLVVKEDWEKARRPVRRILVPVDFSVDSDHAMEVAASLARRLNAKLDVLHVFDLPRDYTPYESTLAMDLEEKVTAGANARLDDACKSLEESQLGVTAHIHRGVASLVIAKVAEEIGCDLIVMGTRGNTGLAHILIGSVAERTIRSATCSVLAVKAVEALR